MDESLKHEYHLAAQRLEARAQELTDLALACDDEDRKAYKSLMARQCRRDAQELRDACLIKDLLDINPGS